VAVNSIIYTELSYTAADLDQVDTAVNIIGLAFNEIPMEAFFDGSSLPNLSIKRRRKASSGFFHWGPCPSFKIPDIDARHRTIPFVFPRSL
jgi:hypothetical protein